jgi:hypothetical protein
MIVGIAYLVTFALIWLFGTGMYLCLEYGMVCNRTGCIKALSVSTYLSGVELNIFSSVTPLNLLPKASSDWQELFQVDLSVNRRLFSGGHFARIVTISIFSYYLIKPSNGGKERRFPWYLSKIEVVVQQVQSTKYYAQCDPFLLTLRTIME